MFLKQLKKAIIKISLTILCLYIMLLLNSIILPKEMNYKLKKEEFTETSVRSTDVQSSNTSLSEKTQVHIEDIQDLTFMEELKQRRARVQKICSTTPNRSKKLLRTMYKNVLLKLYIDEKHNITWCPIYKAASSIFMEMYANLGKVLTAEMQKALLSGHLEIKQLVRQAFPRLKDKVASKVIYSSNRLLVVRHPFERLLSAYRDKLEHQENRKYYYKKYGEKIVKKFGNPGKQVEPSFVDFLQAVARQYVSDEHWRPYHMECAPCLLDYNIILKTESLNKELKQLFIRFGLPNNVSISSVNVNPKGQTNRDIIKKYYSKVPKNLLKLVYGIYKTDFELFSYSPESYFKLTIPANYTQ